MFSAKSKDRNGGYWTRETHLFSADEYVCSVCGSRCKKPERECPSCHSRMRRGKTDPRWIDELGMGDVLFDD